MLSDFKYSLSEMSFNKTHILTDHSDLFLEVVFSYTPSDFSDFVSKVNLKGAVHQGEVSLEDIDKIYPHFDSYEKLEISSKVQGTLNNLRLTNAKMVSRNESLTLEGDLFLKNSIDNREDLRFRIKNGKVDTTAIGHSTKITFSTNVAGNIDYGRIELEGLLDPIAFKRTPNTIAVDAETLEQYVGDYDLMGTEINAYIKDENVLYVFIKGQPEYALISTATHKFNFKTLEFLSTGVINIPLTYRSVKIFSLTILTMISIGYSISLLKFLTILKVPSLLS